MLTFNIAPFIFCYAVDDLACVLEEVQDEHRWFELGLALGLAAPRLNRIKCSHTEVDDRMLDVLQAWLKMEGSVARPSWREMVRALQTRSMNSSALARSIARAHPLI